MFGKARHFHRNREALSLTGVVELTWVLTSAYELERNQMAQKLDGLLRTTELAVTGRFRSTELPPGTAAWS